jgi:hypothetical protein
MEFTKSGFRKFFTFGQIAAWLISPAFAEPIRLTTDGIFKRDPVYILDAAEVAYSVQTESRLYGTRQDAL